jgi:hypothetical protein
MKNTAGRGEWALAARVEGVGVVREGGRPGGGRRGRRQKRVHGRDVAPLRVAREQPARQVHHVRPGAGVLRHALQGDLRQPGRARHRESPLQRRIRELAHLALLQQRLHPRGRAHQRPRARRHEHRPASRHQLQDERAEGVDVAVFRHLAQVRVLRRQVPERCQRLVRRVHHLLRHDVGQAVVCEERVALLVEHYVPCPQVLVHHRQRLRQALVQMREPCSRQRAYMPNA